MAKSKRSNEVPTPTMAFDHKSDEYQIRDDVDSILKHTSLKQDKRRYNRAAGRLKAAARSLERR